MLASPMESKMRSNLSRLNTPSRLLTVSSQSNAHYPEPSILNDGSIWKQRLSASVQRRPSLPVMQERSSSKPEAGEPKMRSAPANRPLLPSISAPEHHILKLLEE